MRAHTPHRRIILLTALAAVLGLAGGGAAWILLHLIALITNLAFTGKVAWGVPSFADLVLGPRIILVAVVGAFIVTCLAKWAPAIRGHGIPEAMEAILIRQSRISPRVAVAKPISTAVAIGTGGPFGAEGPIIVTGGALGSLIGQVIHVSPSERKILLAAGAAAGMAATFGAPLASVMLAIELLLFEFSTRAFVPLVVAASIAAGMHSLFFGAGPLFSVPRHTYAGLERLPLFALLGLACGLLAVVVAKGLFIVEAGYRKLPIGEFWHPLIGAAGFAIVGLIVPRALGVGYDSIEAVLAGKLVTSALLALFAGKLIAWWIALASGTSGGTLAPVMLIGGSFGGILGAAVQHAFPSAHISPGAFAVVAMAATFGAATRATFTSIIFLFELTHDYRVILPLMLASVIADLVAGAILDESVMTEKLARRGLTVRNEYAADVLASTHVRDVMTREVETLSSANRVDEARERLASGHSAYPVIDDAGAVIGILARGDLLREDVADADYLRAVATNDVVTVSPNDTVLVALEKILTEQVSHLPVVSDGKLVGMCTRTDVLSARRGQFALEQRQHGWLRRRSIS